MIKIVEYKGVKTPAIILPCVDSIDAVRELRKGLVDIMDTCLSTEQNTQFTRSTSLWYLHQLIEEINIDHDSSIINQ